jgi:hypothetical protein
MNDFFDEDKIKPEEETSNEKGDFGTSEEIIKHDGTEQKKMENKVALFFHVLIEILKEIFEDTNKNKNQIAKIEGTIQKVKFAEPPLTTVKTEEKIVETTLSPITTEISSIITTESSIITELPPTLSTTTPTTTTEVETTVEITTKALPTITATTTTLTTNLEVPDLSKINIPQLPTESTMSEDDTTATTPTSTAPLISYEIPEIQKFSISQPPTKPTALEEEDTATVLTTIIDPIIVKTTPSLINFEVPNIPKINIPQISTTKISEISTTAETITSTTTSTSLPPTKPPTTVAPTTTQSPSPPSTTQEMHYDDTDDNGIPFWLKVIDGIRCSMRDCSGVLIPTRSPYEQKELKNLTMTRFIREHGLPPCPCLELKELQKVLSSPNKVNSNNNNSQR